MAVSIDAGTDKELTVFTATVHKDKLEEVRSLLSLQKYLSICAPLAYDVIYCRALRQQFYGIFKSMILTPGFRSEDFERLKEEHLNYVSKQYVTYC